MLVLAKVRKQHWFLLYKNKELLNEVSTYHQCHNRKSSLWCSLATPICTQTQVPKHWPCKSKPIHLAVEVNNNTYTLKPYQVWSTWCISVRPNQWSPNFSVIKSPNNSCHHFRLTATPISLLSNKWAQRREVRLIFTSWRTNPGQAVKCLMTNFWSRTNATRV